MTCVTPRGCAASWCVVQGLRNNAAGVGLFKEEFRAAQRLRGAEGVFLQEVRGGGWRRGWVQEGRGAVLRTFKSCAAAVLHQCHMTMHRWR